jgi:hypothetical protein
MAGIKERWIPTGLHAWPTNTVKDEVGAGGEVLLSHTRPTWSAINPRRGGGKEEGGGGVS